VAKDTFDHRAGGYHGTAAPTDDKSSSLFLRRCRVLSSPVEGVHGTRIS
jgi:hypothetical protein